MNEFQGKDWGRKVFSVGQTFFLLLTDLMMRLARRKLFKPFGRVVAVKVEEPKPKPAPKPVAPPPLTWLDSLKAKVSKLPADEQAVIAFLMQGRPENVEMLKDAMEVVRRAVVCECRSCAGKSREQRLRECIE